MDPYAGHPQAMGPPLKVKKKGMPILPILGVLLALGAAAFVYMKYFKKASTGTVGGTVTVTAAQNDVISQATNGTPAVSAAAGGAALAAPVSSVTTALVETPAQAVAQAAASASSTTSAASSTPTSSGPTLTTYKNTTTPGPAGSGLCLSEGGPNGQAALYWCYGGAPQKWTYDSTGGTLAGNSSGNCVTALQQTPGSTIISKTCDSSSPNQQWDWTGNAFKLRGTSNCMDSTTLSNGATISLNPCSGGASQTYTQS